MQTDPIADFLTRLRNAAAAKHQRVDVPVSKLKTEIARILKEEGYISTYKLVDENKTRKMLRVFLKYTPDRRSVITGLKRISRPGALNRGHRAASHQDHQQTSQQSKRRHEVKVRLPPRMVDQPPQQKTRQGAAEILERIYDP